MKRNYEDSFKAKVALEAVKGEKTIAEISQIYDVHANLIMNWKKTLQEGAGELYSRKKKKEWEAEAKEKKIEELERQLGKAHLSVEFLKKKYRQLYGTEPDLLNLR